MDVYYRPLILKNRNNSKRIYVPAGGRLYERYKNVLKRHRELEKLCKENKNEVDIEPTESKRYLNIVIILLVTVLSAVLYSIIIIFSQTFLLLLNYEIFRWVRGKLAMAE